jgi:hypothetical protein
MNREEAVSLLREGKIEDWNRRRAGGERIPPFTAVNLSGADLSEADLRGANLRGINLRGSVLNEANLRSADLRGASLKGANLRRADLRSADLSRVELSGTNLSGANFSEAILVQADFSQADLRVANLSEADLRGTDFQQATVGWTLFCSVDLSSVRGLETLRHLGPSHISTDALVSSKGRIPKSFLEGCGLAPWEILNVGLYDPDLTPDQITNLQNGVFDKRTHGPMLIGGVFISYSWGDSKFVGKLYDRLMREGARVWLDRHEMVAGPMQKQVHRAIRLNDVVLLVLSEASIRSDWVENELEMARRKEREESRDVLCPLALDDSWKSKMDPDEPNRALWLTLRQKLVLDFSKWKTKAFEPTLERLLRGLKMYYPPAEKSPQFE